MQQIKSLLEQEGEQGNNQQEQDRKSTEARILSNQNKTTRSVQMAKCQITVVERSFRKEYVERYVEAERQKTLGPCEVFTEGQTFITDAVSGMPQGFCPWAWDDIYKVLVGYYANGSFNMWTTQGGDVILACCSDGTRPVYFEIKKL
jgi:uncharacterized repeat protein (TIGR04076 family)